MDAIKSSYRKRVFHIRSPHKTFPLEINMRGNPSVKRGGVQAFFKELKCYKELTSNSKGYFDVEILNAKSIERNLNHISRDSRREGNEKGILPYNVLL